MTHSTGPFLGMDKVINRWGNREARVVAGGLGKAKSPLGRWRPSGLFERPSEGSEINSGSDLLSHTVTRAVPLALAGLTSEFGMGSGGTLPL